MPLTVDRTSPTTLVITRHFATAPRRVWSAHTDPLALCRWMTGPDGWAMTECDLELREGGRIAYTWEQRATGQSFRLTGHYEIIDGEQRLVHVERMHRPDPTPDMRVETLFQPDGTGTRLVMTMTLDDPAAMDAMIATGMTDGMEVSYRRFDAMEIEPLGG